MIPVKLYTLGPIDLWSCKLRQAETRNLNSHERIHASTPSDLYPHTLFAGEQSRHNQMRDVVSSSEICDNSSQCNIDPYTVQLTSEKLTTPSKLEIYHLAVNGRSVPWLRSHIPCLLSITPTDSCTSSCRMSLHAANRRPKPRSSICDQGCSFVNRSLIQDPPCV